MGWLERYRRNRCLLQSITNYIGTVGAGFFALQNLSKNWGDEFPGDPSLTDSVKSNPWAGYAWDAQHLQVGALLIAWTFYAFFCEMQGNLSAGRYKRVMTWMLNFPTFVFMIGNMILSSRRTSDGVQTDGSANADYIIGACLLVLVIANTVVFAAHKAYKAEDWFNVVEGELVDDRREDPIDPESILNNRFWLQSLLHLVTIACLLYFCIVGLANYDNNKGWLLTSEYKSNALAVKVWDIAGASVGMLAMPLIIMVVGLELQGDLMPSNYKPICVFVSCINIFTVSIFMYATQWDAFDKGIMHTQTAPLVIMIGLCVTAIICVICYGVMVPYSDAVWLKVLADDEDALDKPPPESPVPDVEQAWGGANETTDAAGASKPQSAEDDDDDVDTKAALPPRLDWRVHPTILEAGLADIIVKWDAPPGTKPEDIQYRVNVTEIEGITQSHDVEHVILDGHHTQYFLDEFAGEPIIPGEQFNIIVDWRYKADADAANGGWQGNSGPTPVGTAPMTAPAALLHSRVPRVHLRDVIKFKSNSDMIKRGGEALPAVAQLLTDHPDMTLTVDGHVNFGQREAAAMRLSQARAERVCHMLGALGVAPERLQSVGHGWSRPRFPRGSKLAGKNRRVEFRVQPGSALFERLASEAAARRNSVNGGDEGTVVIAARPKELPPVREMARRIHPASSASASSSVSASAPASATLHKKKGHKGKRRRRRQDRGDDQDQGQDQGAGPGPGPGPGHQGQGQDHDQGQHAEAATPAPPAAATAAVAPPPQEHKDNDNANDDANDNDATAPPAVEQGAERKDGDIHDDDNTSNTDKGDSTDSGASGQRDHAASRLDSDEERKHHPSASTPPPTGATTSREGTDVPLVPSPSAPPAKASSPRKASPSLEGVGRLDMLGEQQD